MSGNRFALASNVPGTQWLTKASRGEVVTATERNAFVAQAGAVMDALAQPSRFVSATGALTVPTVPYNGDVPGWNGRRVPVIGTAEAPREWFEKAARNSGALTWADLLLPTDDERRRLYLSMGNVMKSLHVEGSVVRRYRVERTAGVVPVVAVVAVVCVVGLCAFGVYMHAHTEEVEIREREETARAAEELSAAQAAWLQRVRQGAANPGQPLPPQSPAETRVLTRPQPSTPSRGEQGESDFLKNAKSAAMELALYGGGALLVATALPPVVTNLADRATRSPGVSRV